MEHMTLIHPFQVNAEQEQHFLDCWKKVDEYMKKQKGFISTSLYRGLSHPKLAAFSFINVALWENNEAFQLAVSNDNFMLLAKEVLTFSRGPGLYNLFTN